MIEWWQIIIAIAAVIGAGSEIYLRLVPDLRRKQNAKRECHREIRNQLDIFIAYVECYDWGGIGSIEKAYVDAPISNELRKELDELVAIALQYHRWRYECYQVINAEVRAQSKLYPTLDEAFLNVFRSGFEHVLGGADGSRSEEIYRAIYKGELTFDIAKESLLKDYWGSKVKIHDKSGEEKELMFKDIIDGEDFHRFFKELKGLQEREPVKILRDAQAKFVEKAGLILKEA